MINHLLPGLNLSLKRFLALAYQAITSLIFRFTNVFGQMEVVFKKILQPQDVKLQRTIVSNAKDELSYLTPKNTRNQPNKSLYILGSRGLPAKYGGFETFAERLSLYLVSKGWKVTVYCQNDDSDELFEKDWNSIHLIYIPTPLRNAVGSIIFDWKSILHASKQDGIILTLGYNTAIFCFWYRLKGMTNLINMDGMEWRRQKWNTLEKAWLYLNERVGCLLANHLIADHPEIKAHLATYTPSEKIAVIPYGAELVLEADSALLEPYNLVPNEYIIVIARPEPENSILEIVSAFSKKTRNLKLVILGRYFTKIPYHQQVKEAASDEVVFLGAIHDKPVVNALRFYARLYVHGHTVGGTNPSLVEALGAGIPVLAQDNRFNCWVAGPGAHYFQDENECEQELDRLLHDQEELSRMKSASLERYQAEFSDAKDLKAYEAMLRLHLNPLEKFQLNSVVDKA